MAYFENFNVVAPRMPRGHKLGFFNGLVEK